MNKMFVHCTRYNQASTPLLFVVVSKGSMTTNCRCCDYIHIIYIESEDSECLIFETHY